MRVQMGIILFNHFYDKSRTTVAEAKYGHFKGSGQAYFDEYPTTLTIAHWHWRISTEYTERVF